MRTRLVGSLVGVSLALLLVGGCGSSSETTDTSTAGASSGTASSPAASADADSDSTSDGGESAAGPMFCDLLTADQIGAAIGATVTMTQGPMDLCEFTQEDPRALGGSVGATRVDIGNGGYEGYVTGARLTLTDPVEVSLEGIGEQAFITTGTFAGGENLQGAGGVLVGGTVYTVNLSQGSGLTQEQLVEAGTKLLTLLVTAAS